MSAVLKFTNCFGETNHGLVIDTNVNGMLLIFWDTFEALLSRLEQRGKVSDFVRNGLSVRQSWVRVEAEGPNGAKMEILPIDTPVEWSSQELRLRQIEIRKGIKQVVQDIVFVKQVEPANSTVSNIFRGQAVEA